jgi:hypothetical protein
MDQLVPGSRNWKLSRLYGSKRRQSIQYLKIVPTSLLLYGILPICYFGIQCFMEHLSPFIVQDDVILGMTFWIDSFVRDIFDSDL